MYEKEVFGVAGQEYICTFEMTRRSSSWHMYIASYYIHLRVPALNS